MNVPDKYYSYMCKEADGLLESMSGVIEKTPWLLALPIGGGLLVGGLASKLSSPTNADVETLQKEFIKQRLQQHLALKRRELDILLDRLDVEKAKNAALKGDLVI